MKKLSITIAFVCILSSYVSATNCHGSSKHSTDKQSPDKTATEKHKTLKVQTLCPITKNSVDRDVYVDFEGDEHYTPKRIYVCCEDCIPKVNKKPARCVKKLFKMEQPVENRLHHEDESSAGHDDGSGQNESQKISDKNKCPVMGNDIDKSVFTDYKGNKVYFCCEGCIEMFKEDPETYLKNLD